MLEALGHDTERKGLHASLSFILRRAVREYARQVGDLSDPTTVVFSLELYLERHAASVTVVILAVLVALREVRRTPRISCEAVRAQKWSFARMSRHLRTSHGAGESFVCCIRLFDSTQRLPRRSRLRASSVQQG